MLTIIFHPDSDRPEYMAAMEEYQRLWEAEGAHIVDRLEMVSGLRFIETMINATVFEGMSHAYPLCFRASYPADVKKAAIVHELCHRLLDGNNVGEPRPGQQLESHKRVDLILFDVWADLYGEAFARQQVDVESQRQPLYREAWDWALALDRVTRAARFRDLIRGQNGDRL